MKKIISFMLTLAALVGVAAPAFAADPVTVTYQGQDADDKLLITGEIFSDISYVMPGDTIAETVVLKNDEDSGANAQMYVRAEPETTGLSDEDAAAMRAFLSQIRLTVTPAGSATGYTAPAGDAVPPFSADGSPNRIDLGMLRAGAESTVEIKLEVSEDLSNDYQGAAGKIKWTFSADEFDAESEVGLTIGVEITNKPANDTFYNYQEDIEYTLTVKNTGTVPLKNIVVKDPFDKNPDASKVEAADTVESLAAGATETTEGLRHTVSKNEIVSLTNELAEELNAENIDYFATGTGYWTHTTFDAAATAQTSDGADVPPSKIVLVAVDSSVATDGAGESGGAADADAPLEVSIVARFPGDINVDGQVTLSDAILALRIAALQMPEDDANGPTIFRLNGVVWERDVWKEQDSSILSDANLLLRFTALQDVTLY